MVSNKKNKKEIGEDQISPSVSPALSNTSIDPMNQDTETTPSTKSSNVKRSRSSIVPIINNLSTSINNTSTTTTSSQLIESPRNPIPHPPTLNTSTRKTRGHSRKNSSSSGPSSSEISNILSEYKDNVVQSLHRSRQDIKDLADKRNKMISEYLLLSDNTSLTQYDGSGTKSITDSHQLESFLLQKQLPIFSKQYIEDIVNLDNPNTSITRNSLHHQPPPTPTLPNFTMDDHLPPSTTNTTTITTTTSTPQQKRELNSSTSTSTQPIKKFKRDNSTNALPIYAPPTPTSTTTTLTTPMAVSTTSTVVVQPEQIPPPPPVIQRNYPPSAFVPIPPLSKELINNAHNDAKILRRIHELQKQGIWGPKLLTKLPEPPRPKVHWDLLLEEMALVSEDFIRFKRLKHKVLNVIGKDLQEYHSNKHFSLIKSNHNSNGSNQHYHHLDENRKRKQCMIIANEIKQFWSRIHNLKRFQSSLNNNSNSNNRNTTRRPLNPWISDIKMEDNQYDDGDDEDDPEYQSSDDESVDCRIGTEQTPVEIDGNNQNAEVITSSSEDESDLSDSDLEDDEDEEEVEEDISLEDLEMLHKESQMPLEEILTMDEIIDSVLLDIKVGTDRALTVNATSGARKVPVLLKFPLREYQLIGMDWLVSMYELALNAVLTDDKGLEKSVQVMAMISYLAAECGQWGPHLIVVPGENNHRCLSKWELQFKSWCPGLKVSTYTGSGSDKRDWHRNDFYVCLTTLSLVYSDYMILNRKKWSYLIVDNVLPKLSINVNSSRRLLLLDSNPITNDIQSIWTLCQFLFPNLSPFKSQLNFGNINNLNDISQQFQSALAPYTLGRLRSTVESQLPKERIHQINCKLLKSQQTILQDIHSKENNTNNNNNTESIVNIITEISRVCDHPQLCQDRIVSLPWCQSDTIQMEYSSRVVNVRNGGDGVNLSLLNLQLPDYSSSLSNQICNDIVLLQPQESKFQELYSNYIKSLQSNQQSNQLPQLNSSSSQVSLSSSHSGITTLVPNSCLDIYTTLRNDLLKQHFQDCIDRVKYSQKRTSKNQPLYGYDLIYLVTVNKTSSPRYCQTIQEMILTPTQRSVAMEPELKRFSLLVNKVLPQSNISLIEIHPSSVSLLSSYLKEIKLISTTDVWKSLFAPFYPSYSRQSLMNIPNDTLHGSGKLLELSKLLPALKEQNHRVLVYSHYEGMIQILERFFKYHGYPMVKIDCKTKQKKRHLLLEKFNTDTSIFLMLLSTRTGELNVHGADTVIMYDQDWISSTKNTVKATIETTGHFTNGRTIYNLQVPQYQNLIELYGNSVKLNNNNSNNSSITIDNNEWRHLVESIEDPLDLLSLRQFENNSILEIEKHNLSHNNNNSKISKYQNSRNDELLDYILEPIQKYALTRANEKNSNDINENVQADPEETDCVSIDQKENKIISILSDNPSETLFDLFDNTVVLDSNSSNGGKKLEDPLLFFQVNGMTVTEFQSSLLGFGEMFQRLPDANQEQWFLAPMQEPIPHDLLEEIMKDLDEHYHQHYNYMYPPIAQTITFESIARPSRSKLKRGKVIKQLAQHNQRQQMSKEKEKEKKLQLKKKKEKDKKEKARLEEERRIKEKRELKMKNARDKSFNANKQISSMQKKKLDGKRLVPDDIIATSHTGTSGSDRSDAEFEELAGDLEESLTKNLKSNQNGDQMLVDSSQDENSESSSTKKRKHDKNIILSSSTSGSKKISKKEFEGDTNLATSPSSEDLLTVTSPWTQQEDSFIMESVRQYGQNWDLISFSLCKMFHNLLFRVIRTKLQTIDRYKSYLLPREEASKKQQQLVEDSQSGHKPSVPAHEGEFSYSLLDMIKKTQSAVGAASKLPGMRGSAIQAQFDPNMPTHVSHLSLTVSLPLSASLPSVMAGNTTKIIKENKAKLIQQQQQQQQQLMRPVVPPTNAPTVPQNPQNVPIQPGPITNPTPNVAPTTVAGAPVGAPQPQQVQPPPISIPTQPPPVLNRSIHIPVLVPLPKSNNPLQQSMIGQPMPTQPPNIINKPMPQIPVTPGSAAASGVVNPVQGTPQAPPTTVPPPTVGAPTSTGKTKAPSKTRTTKKPKDKEPKVKKLTKKQQAAQLQQLQLQQQAAVANPTQPSIQSQIQQQLLHQSQPQPVQFQPQIPMFPNLPNQTMIPGTPVGMLPPNLYPVPYPNLPNQLPQ
ncbi:myb domain-containing protein [Tieghemostelium lacteum]|uniref:Myb domain-containing protein n=1 Tax=Tieghemostelium lacteum TaxID=361077 RepID=A0A151ZJG7_TIELA|nr:myb domain-containing protein [Tieghemostelium lacteum]|eukprot:KYQ94123.1 myb domain-containing protein [Tieghemostelium lacteum]